MLEILYEAYTFDDLLLVPSYSEVLPKMWMSALILLQR